MKYIFDEWNRTYELYNLKEDPKETTNLASNKDDIPKELQKILNMHLKFEIKSKKRIEKDKISRVISQDLLKRI